MDGNQIEGNQVNETTPKEGEQVEPSKGTGGTPGEEERQELEQLQQQIKELEALQGKKDKELESLKAENDTYKTPVGTSAFCFITTLVTLPLSTSLTNASYV